jgi:two-component system, LytTR family, response regulator
MYRCLAIDDEPLALSLLADYIQRDARLQLIDVLTNPLDGIKRVKNGEADLVFLDIQMPQLTGIEFMEQTRNSCRIILTTAYPEFALKGYEYNVVDYLLKPVSFERFSQAISKLPVNHSKAETADFFFVKSGYKFCRINYSDIIYLESLRDYVAIHLINGPKILSQERLSHFEKTLPSNRFTRIHKSYIVSIEKIIAIEKMQVSVGDTQLPVGDTYKEEFMSRVRG